MKKAFLQLHLAVFLAGFTAILGKLIELNEVLLVFYRVLIAVPVLALLIAFRSGFKSLHPKYAFQAAAVGCIIAIHWVAFYASVKYANVSVALVCFAATGFFTALLEPLVMKKRIEFTELMLGLLSIAGIYIIFDFYPQFQTGIIFGVIAAVGSALFPIFNKQLLNHLSPAHLTLFSLSGCVLFLPLVIPVYLHFFPAAYFYPTSTDWAWLTVLAILCTIIPFDLQLKSLRKISAFTVNLTYNLEPFYGIGMAFAIFGEHREIGWKFYLGMLLVMISLLLQMYRVWRQPERKQVVIKNE
ncbi:MAG TPA: DMT family transporter [Ferruginibacter sp.]|nr:DMT family transporter [Ferruginibacter sp.]HRO95792.1 DMT family transporter [Ferruginibacter sp.]HRP49199.1 DMT family transporter [Ferruginibacter sp.]